MVKLLGCALVGTGCLWLGLQAAVRLRRAGRRLERLCAALEMMERELVLRRTALPELLERLECRDGLFGDCLARLGRGAPFPEAWAGALDKSGLEDGARDALGALGPVLGRYDAQGQGESVARVRRDLERQAVRAGEEARRLGRVYAALGAAGGAFLVIILL